MNMKTRYALMVLCVIVVSCSSSQFGWKEGQETSDKEIRNKRLLENFDPLSLEDDDIVIRPVEKTSQSDEIESREREERDQTTEKITPEMVQGYRVQLLATGDEIQAREAKKNAIFRFQEGIYLVFEAPLYKLRLGDCQTRKEAEELRDRAVRNGFPDAWVVPSKVHLTKNMELND